MAQNFSKKKKIIIITGCPKLYHIRSPFPHTVHTGNHPEEK